jgi:hypothetical protein
MKSDKALRRIAAMRRNGQQPVAEYVAALPPDLRNTVLDSLTLPERRALEHLLKARRERRRVQAIEDDTAHRAHREAAAQQEAARKAELSEFIDGLKAQRLTGNAARFAAASRAGCRQKGIPASGATGCRGVGQRGPRLYRRVYGRSRASLAFLRGKC